MIYHITQQTQWQKALQEGAFETDSLHTEGFIHASQDTQVAGVLHRYYQGISHLVKLHIDETKLTSPLRWEHSPSVNEEFPHIYGKINLEAVVEVEII
jgi:uncharacterized protein (DUF952 family)